MTTTARLTTFRSVADLEHLMGARPRGAMAKSIPTLDDHALRFLQRSPGATLGIGGEDGPTLLVVGGEPGCLLESTSRVRLPVAGGEGVGLRDGLPAGLCALVPGYAETLRVNGRLHVRGGEAHLDVEEVFLHCGKCMLRSHLWDHAPERSEVTAEDASTVVDDLLDPAVTDILRRSPFVFLASTDAAGGHDVSPKGDPGGFVMPLDGGRVALPDRPGNRRTDTFHNLLDDDRLALLALVPGDDRALVLRGRAGLSTDPALLDAMTVDRHTPTAALVLTVEATRLAHSPGLAAARFWDPARRAEPGALPRAAQVWRDHVAQSSGGLVGRAAGALPVSVLHAGLERDYRTNLY